VTFDSLREFVDALDGAGELVRVTAPVSLDLELCEIADRVMKQARRRKRPADRVADSHERQRSSYPVGINLFGSMRRIAMALETETRTPSETASPSC